MKKQHRDTHISSTDLERVSSFEVLLEKSLAGVYIIQDNKFRYVNRSFARIFGYENTSDIIDNVEIIDLIAEESRETVAENIRRRITGEDDSLHYFFTGIRKDGVKIEVEVHGSRADFKGKPAVIGMLLDVTENKRMQAEIIEHEQKLERQVEERTKALDDALNKLKETEERYRVLFNDSKVPMLLIEPDTGLIVDANDAASIYYGYTHKKLTNLRIYDINQLSNEEIVDEIENAKHNNRNHFFFIHKLANGTLRDVEVHSGPLEIGNRKLLYSIIHDVTDRRLAEEQLKELNRDFITLLENTTDFVYFKDKESRFRFCSQTLARITGHESWRDMVGKHDLEVFPPETAKIYHEEEYPVFREGKALLNRVDPYIDEYGNRGWVSTNKWPVFDEGTKDVIGLFGISRDVTAQHNAEIKLKIAASVFENASEGILITDAEANVVEVNQAFCKISGYSREEVLNQNPRFLKSGHHDEGFFKNMWKSLEQTGYWQGEIWNRHKDGSLFACHTSINALTGTDGKVNRYIGLHSDITDLLKHYEEVKHMAYYDMLTGLPNRVLMFDRMSQAMAMSDRTETTLAVCFLDLDMFKPVNDRFGHKVGDLLLIEIAQRLKHCVRTEDTVARLGGDEFALLLTHLTHEDDLLHLLDRVITMTAEPFTISSNEIIRISCSLGVSLYPQSKVSADQLLKLADKAMYEAKELGRNQYRLCEAFSRSGKESQ